MSTRAQNEAKFGNWEELPHGGRRYWYEVKGHQGWVARYVKKVDDEENTLLFLQEIYDDRGKLVEVHKKYPVDEGHQEVKED